MTDPDKAEDHRETHRRSGVVSGAAMMLGSSYLDMILGVARGILVMRLIGPTGRGIMRTVALAHRYLTHSHLGILHGLSKDLPQALGRNDTEAADRIESVAATYVTLTAVLSGLAMVLAALWLDLGLPTKLALMAGGGILVNQQVYALYRCALRAWGRFSVLATAGIINALAQFSFIIVGAVLLKVTGAMLGWLLATAITILYFRFAVRLAVPINFDRREALRLLLIGLPMAMVVFSDTLLRTVDAAIVVKQYSIYRYGLYSVAMQVATYLYAIPEVGGFVIMPRIFEQYAAKGDVAGLRRQIMLPTFAAATLMPVLAGIAFILMPPAIEAIVPRFEGCIFAAQTLALASVLLALPVAANGLLVALNREFVVVLNKVVGSLVVFAGAGWHAAHGGSLRQIALAAGAGYFVASLLSLVDVLIRYYPSRGALVAQVLLCYAPFAWSIAALRLSGWMTRTGLDPLGSEWWQVILRTAIFLILMAPVIAYGNARTGLIHELTKVARRAFARLRRPRDS